MDIPLFIKKTSKKLPTFPEDHKPAIKVPKGGSSCATCVFYSKDGGAHGICNSNYYFEYYGSKEIPLPADEFCSDWYTPIEEDLG